MARTQGARRTAPASRRRRGRPPDTALDDQILRAALTLLGEVGYEGLSLEEVARRAGTAKTSVYRRWPGRDALTLAAVRLYLDETADGGRRGALPDTGSLRGDLIAHATGLARMLTRERIAVFAGLLLAIRTNPELATLVRTALVQREVSSMTRILDRAVARGELDPAPPSPLLLHLVPAVLFTRLLVLDQPPDDRLLAQLVDDLLLPLLRPVRRRVRGTVRRQTGSRGT